VAQCEGGIGAPHGGVEQLPLLVPDVDQHRLLAGELIDGGQHVVDVTGAGVFENIVDCSRFASVTDLAGCGDIPGPGRHPPVRLPPQGYASLQIHSPTIVRPPN
jgi:hypothetical protein